MTPKIINPTEKRAALEEPEPNTLAERRLSAFRNRILDAIEVSRSMKTTVLVGTADAMHVDIVLRELRNVGWEATFVPDWRDGNYLQIVPASSTKETSIITGQTVNGLPADLLKAERTIIDLRERLAASEEAYRTICAVIHEGEPVGAVAEAIALTSMLGENGVPEERERIAIELETCFDLYGADMCPLDTKGAKLLLASVANRIRHGRHLPS